jgi:hypothetical protein
MNDINASNPLREYFERNPGRLLDKWEHYFDAYHRHLQRFRGTACTLVEIGIYHGGSLQMWRDYLGPQARIVGVDVNPRCRELAEPGIEVVIGDQADPRFLADLRRQLPRIDILIDDGGHTMVQQTVTFQYLFPHMDRHGVYLCEDMHTSYWREFGGGYRQPHTFIEFAKGLVDQLNAWHSKDPNSFAPTPMTEAISSLHFYDSMLVIERSPRQPPARRMTGTPSFPDTPDGVPLPPART